MWISIGAVEAHRAQIERNHGLTLEQLNADGGLDWIELWCGFNDRPLYPGPYPTDDAARTFVLRAVTEDSFRR